MFLEVLITIFLNISNNTPHLELRIHFIRTVIITNAISNVGRKRMIVLNNQLITQERGTQCLENFSLKVNLP